MPVHALGRQICLYARFHHNTNGFNHRVMLEKSLNSADFRAMIALGLISIAAILNSIPGVCPDNASRLKI